MSALTDLLILNVAHDEATRHARNHMLRQAGFRVVDAATGGDGLRVMAAEPLQLVILEVDLPDISGFEVCRRIKATAATAFVPVLYLAARPVAAKDLACELERGADSYLLEPVEPQVLLAMVRVLLRMGQAEETLRASAINERKRAEQERSQLLLREQAARREAEAANRAKDVFLATVSHEVRTPLNAILGWARLLRSGKLDPATSARAIESIERNATAQSQLIDDLLDISRIIAGKLSLEVGLVELGPIILAAVESIRPAAVAKAIDLESTLDPAVGQVSGDPQRLQQVIGNLLSNAIKFTPEGGRVHVRLDCLDACARITVSDTGQGINPEFLPYVFERFRQAGAATTRPQSGLGLGLAIVRHLVELHGGTVQADSPGEGQGATFTIDLPLAQLRISDFGFRNELVAGTESALRTPHSEISLDGLRVLVVDDEADARELLVVLLTQYGAEVQAAASAQEALEALDRWPPDVLVSDIAMPDVDGYALIQKVRARAPEHGGRIPAVALTAYARAEDRTRALVAGFQMHIAKPVNPAELAVVIATLARG